MYFTQSFGNTGNYVRYIQMWKEKHLLSIHNLTTTTLKSLLMSSKLQIQVVFLKISKASINYS